MEGASSTDTVELSKVDDSDGSGHTSLTGVAISILICGLKGSHGPNFREEMGEAWELCIGVSLASCLSLSPSRREQGLELYRLCVDRLEPAAEGSIGQPLRTPSLPLSIPHHNPNSETGRWTLHCFLSSPRGNSAA